MFDNAELEKLLPKMRIWALAWTRDPDKASDLVNDTVVHVLEKKEYFDGSDKLSQWIAKVMRNLFVSQLRRKRITHDLIVENDDVFIIPACQESGIVARELRELLDQLPDEQRRSLLLACEEEKSYAEIAIIEGISEGTVKSRVSRGRDQLAILLGEGIGSRNDRLDEIRDRRLKSDSDMAAVLRLHPKWFCIWDGKAAKVMNGRTIVAEAKQPGHAWRKAKEIIDGRSEHRT